MEICFGITIPLTPHPPPKKQSGNVYFFQKVQIVKLKYPFVKTIRIMLSTKLFAIIAEIGHFKDLSFFSPILILYLFSLLTH